MAGAGTGVGGGAVEESGAGKGAEGRGQGRGRGRVRGRGRGGLPPGDSSCTTLTPAAAELMGVGGSVGVGGRGAGATNMAASATAATDSQPYLLSCPTQLVRDPDLATVQLSLPRYAAATTTGPLASL